MKQAQLLEYEILAIRCMGEEFGMADGNTVVVAAAEELSAQSLSTAGVFVAGRPVLYTLAAVRNG